MLIKMQPFRRVEVTITNGSARAHFSRCTRDGRYMPRMLEWHELTTETWARLCEVANRAPRECLTLHIHGWELYVI